MTLGANCLGLVVFVPLLSRYFVRNRGMAVSVVQSANGFARAFSAPVTTMMIAGLGWRGAYLWQGVFMGVGAAAAGLAVPRRREGASAPPDRTSSTAGRCAGDAHAAFLAARSRSIMFTGLGRFLVALHQLAFAVDIGFDKLYAAGVLGMGAFLSLPGVIITGTISDYIGRELSAIVTYGTSILGVVLRADDHSPGSASAAVAACVLLRPDLGRAGPGDHREDGGSVSRPEPGHDPGRHHDRHRPGRRRAGRGWPASCST